MTPDYVWLSFYLLSELNVFLFFLVSCFVMLNLRHWCRLQNRVAFLCLLAGFIIFSSAHSYLAHFFPPFVSKKSIQICNVSQCCFATHWWIHHYSPFRIDSKAWSFYQNLAEPFKLTPSLSLFQSESIVHFMFNVTWLNGAIFQIIQMQLYVFCVQFFVVVVGTYIVQYYHFLNAYLPPKMKETFQLAAPQITNNVPKSQR